MYVRNSQSPASQPAKLSCAWNLCRWQISYGQSQNKRTLASLWHLKWMCVTKSGYNHFFFRNSNKCNKNYYHYTSARFFHFSFVFFFSFIYCFSFCFCINYFYHTTHALLKCVNQSKSTKTIANKCGRNNDDGVAKWNVCACAKVAARLRFMLQRAVKLYKKWKKIYS